jgi:cytoskeleton protein RodZ
VQTAAQPVQPEIGLQLRRAREARGLSLDELTRSTKINTATLAAIESGDIQKLPAPIYARGFIKAYAAEVGLDPTTVANAYLTGLVPDTEQVRTGVSAGSAAAMTSPSHDGRASIGTSRQLLEVNHVRRFSRLTTLAAAVGLAVYIVSFSRHTAERRAPGDATDNDAARSTPVADANRALTTTSEAISMTINGPLTVELVPQGPCWLVATVDGARVIARLLQPGERQTLAIMDEALLRVGDPGALSISINGQTGRVLGRPGQPVNVKITKDNFKEFLSS